MISQQYKDLLKRHLEAENTHKLEDATLTEDCVFNDKALSKLWFNFLYYDYYWSYFQRLASELV